MPDSLGTFFAFGAGMATATCIALLFPGGEQLRSPKPEAHTAFLAVGA